MADILQRQGMTYLRSTATHFIFVLIFEGKEETIAVPRHFIQGNPEDVFLTVRVEVNRWMPGDI